MNRLHEQLSMPMDYKLHPLFHMQMNLLDFQGYKIHTHNGHCHLDRWVPIHVNTNGLNK